MKKYQLGIYEKAFPERLSMSEILLSGKEAGYDFFEINIDRTDYRINRIYDKAYIKQLKSYNSDDYLPIRSLGLSALSTYTLGNNNSEIEKRAIDIFVHTVSMAEELGIRLIQIPACDVPKGTVSSIETHKRFLYNLKKLVEYASSQGVLIGLENMETQYSDSISKCRLITNAINSPFFRLYPDAGNLTRAFDNNICEIISDFEMNTDQILAFHCKEVSQTRFGGLFYGEGIVDFPLLISKAYSLGVRRFCMEYWHIENSDWKKNLITSRNLFSEWIKN